MHNGAEEKKIKRKETKAKGTFIQSAKNLIQYINKSYSNNVEYNNLNKSLAKYNFILKLIKKRILIKKE